MRTHLILICLVIVSRDETRDCEDCLRESISPGSFLADDQFPAIEAFSVLGRRVGFDPTKPEEGKEGILSEPALFFLRLENTKNRLDLPMTNGLVQMNEKIGGDY